MILKPQDVLILLKLVAWGPQSWTYQRLAVELSISQSEAHAGVRRAVAARLMSDTSTSDGRPILPALEEFLVHGVRYAYPPERGPMTDGMPTGYAAPQLNKVIVQPNEPPPVWRFAQGTVRGYSFAPLFPCVPMAASRDPVLYELLALVDAIRGGLVRERELAVEELSLRLGDGARTTQATLPPAEARSTLHPPVMTYAATPAKGGGEKLRVSRPKLETVCRKFGIARLSLFGSASRNELRPESDVDLMVDFLPNGRQTLFDISTMQEEFSAAFGGRKVDIVTPEILSNPFRRDSIVLDLKVVYEA